MTADTFSKLASAFNSIAAAIAIVVGGAWALTRFSVLLEARIAHAQAEKAEADAVLARRQAEVREVVNVDISAQVLTNKTPRKEKWVSVAVTLKNTGAKEYIISLDDDVRFYVAKVLRTKENGETDYGDMLRLAFDYADKRLTWFNLKPGAEIDSYRAVKKLDSSGLYIARFSVRAPKIGDKPGREYSAQTYFLVD